MKFIRDLISRKRESRVEEVPSIEDIINAKKSKENVDAALRTVKDAAEGKSVRFSKADAGGKSARGKNPAPGEEKPVLGFLGEATDIGDLGEDMLNRVSTKVKAEAPAQQPVNIWDLDGDIPADDTAKGPGPAAQDKTLPPSPMPARASSRKRRTKTRLIGFEKSGGDVVDLFDSAASAAPAARAKFPVGWVIVTDGPGRGECFTLVAGMSQIGRGEDQAVQLDFGDNSISRTNHAAIVYDPENKSFLVGHGGKSNIVRLNDKPLISNETLKDGDVLKLGETTLRFAAFCGDKFSWSSDGDDKEAEDVAIA